MGGGEEKRGGGGSGGKEKNRAADDGPPALAGEHAGREKATDTDDAHRIRRGSDTHPGQKAIAAQAQNSCWRKQTRLTATGAHGRNTGAATKFNKE